MHQLVLSFVHDSLNDVNSSRSDSAIDYFWREVDCPGGVALYFIAAMLEFASAGNVRPI